MARHLRTEKWNRGDYHQVQQTFRLRANGDVEVHTKILDKGSEVDSWMRVAGRKSASDFSAALQALSMMERRKASKTVRQREESRDIVKRLGFP